MPNFRYFVIVAAMLAVIAAVRALPIISSQGGPEFAFAYRVEAIVEGERIVLETSQGCVTKYYGELSHGTKAYGNVRFSIGHRLPSGRGFFAVVPDFCYFVDIRLDPPQWPASVRETPREIIPMLYFADDYDEPQEFLFNIDPAGYSPERDGVELISATLRPLIGDEKDTVPQLLGEEQAPMRKGVDAYTLGYFFYPVPDTHLPELGMPDFVDPTGRYEFYSQVGKNILHVLGFHPHPYFLHLGDVADRTNTAKHYDARERKKRRVNPGHFADPNRTTEEAFFEDIPRILPLRLTEDGTWMLMPANGGWAHIYDGLGARYQLMQAQETRLIEIGNGQAEMQVRPQVPEGAGLRDRLTGQFYIADYISFSGQVTERK